MGGRLLESSDDFTPDYTIKKESRNFESLDARFLSLSETHFYYIIVLGSQGSIGLHHACRANSPGREFFPPGDATLRPALRIAADRNAFRDGGISNAAVVCVCRLAGLRSLAD